jgi:hypothetical protein
LRHRSSEVSNELLVGFACLDPKNTFFMFDVEKLIGLEDLYDQDFSVLGRAMLREHFETYIIHVRMNVVFATCEDIESLFVKMVQTGKHVVFPLVYKLIELTLLLPMSTKHFWQ